MQCTTKLQCSVIGTTNLTKFEGKTVKTQTRMVPIPFDEEDDTNDVLDGVGKDADTLD